MGFCTITVDHICVKRHMLQYFIIPDTFRFRFFLLLFFFNKWIFLWMRGVVVNREQHNVFFSKKCTITAYDFIAILAYELLNYFFV